jgi:L-alanine-DL-glutamate epimerase-like enolase superfamily enzyme
MKLEYWVVEHKLASVFRIAKGAYEMRRALIIRLIDNGITGLGEATEVQYYPVQIEKMIQVLEQYREKLENITLTTPESFYNTIEPWFGEVPFLLSAIDCAGYDIYGKKQNMAVRHLWAPSEYIESKTTSFTIGLDRIEAMTDRIRAVPWPVYKIKLGTPDDRNIIETIRKCTDRPIRVDINEGWEPGEALQKCEIMYRNQVEFVEQPLAKEELQEIENLFRKSPVTLFADESCQSISDIRTCKGKFHGINIKLMKCGGITPALKMIEQARSLGFKIMIGCMTESSIGISAAAQLIPLVEYVDLDGAMLIARDIATGVRFEYGSPVYPDLPGLGVELVHRS